MKTEIIKNKDGSVTYVRTTVEEETISAEDVEATISSKKAQLESTIKLLEGVEYKYNKLKEQEVERLKFTIESINLELNSL